MTNKKPLIILVGPTAVGKTKISIEVAKQLGCQIISADSMQVYKYMDIGTAKITDEEQQGIKHYLIDEVFPNEDFSVSDFQRKANNYIDTIISKNKIPLIVGGTGLYVNSLVYDLDFTNAVSNWNYRDKLLEEIEMFGNEYIYNKLKDVDPESAARIHINDSKRIVRALEVYHETGKTMSSSYDSFRKPSPYYDVVMIGLKMDRTKLYERINLRVDKMIEMGLIEEVRKLLDMGYHDSMTSMKGLGYKEIIKYLEGEYTYNEAIEILKRDSRRFAKRQLTWFRRDDRIYWVDIDEITCEEVVSNIIKYVRETLKSNRIFNNII